MEEELRTWKIHVNIRCGIDMPCKEKDEEAILPSTFVECGWTVYNERVPEEDKLQFTRTVDEEPNPVFNEQLVVEPPASVHERDGFLYVGLQFKDEYQFERAIYIPLSIMSTFVPYHFQVYTGSLHDSSSAKAILVFSVFLEEQFSDNFLDSSVNLSVYDLILEPLPFKISSAMILMTLDCHEPTWLPFIKYDVNQSDNLSQKVLEYTMKNEKVWASPTISVPPLKSDHASLVCKFPLLKSMLNRNITFYLMTRDESIPTNHPLPNTVVGQTEICDLQLKTLLYANAEDNGMVPLVWNKKNRLFRAFEDVRGRIELNVRLQNDFEPIKQNVIPSDK